MYKVKVQNPCSCVLKNGFAKIQEFNSQVNKNYEIKLLSKT